MPKYKASIMIVDDAPDTLEILQRNLTSQGFQVFSATNVAEAIQFITTRPVDLVITDLKMPKVSGLDLVRHVKANMRDTAIMMITGYATVEGAVKAIKVGAEEYLPKPFTDEELIVAVEGILKKLFARRMARSERKEKFELPEGMIGQSSKMNAVYRAINKAATTTATVLIVGESGTGKELVARAIHYNSNRASASFVPVNCGGIPEGLLESELFGHVKGAFTGAISSRAGFFQTADGGTIFLDEISETSQSMQVKLLRVLQEREISMVGTSRTRKIDIRIVAATNKDLHTLVKQGVIREDLYFRLGVLTLNLPPLRERGDDILLLTSFFADKFAKELGKSSPHFSDEALDILKSYNWPGNVRELEHLMQHLVVMVDSDTIDVPDLPSLMRFAIAGEDDLSRSLAEVEEDYIRRVLIAAGGNRTKAAEILKIDRKTLRAKLRDNS